MKLPPHNLDAEKAVLGGLLIKPAALDVVRGILKRVDDFFLPAHREVFEALVELAAAGQAPDAVALADRLRVKGVLNKLENGPAYLLVLSGSVPTAENVGYYARVVKKKAVLRQLIAACQDVAAQAHGDVEPEDLVAEHLGVVDGLDVGAERGPVRVGDAMDGAIETIEKRAVNPGGYSVPWGLREVDEKFGGMVGGQLVVVAARPSLGKTSLLLNTIVRGSMMGIPSLLFSLEMSLQELVERKLSFVGRVPGRGITRGELTPGDWIGINAASKKLAPLDLYVDDREDVTVEQICHGARVWAREVEERVRSRRREEARVAGKPLEDAPVQKVVWVDSASLVTLEEEGDNRAADVAKVSRMLKRLAKSLKCPVGLIVHLNREIEKSAKARKPKLSDLRESGAIEQDADVVVFPYREPGYAGASTGPVPAVLVFGKNRNGATGEVAVSWDGRFMGFYDAEDESP